MQDLGSGETDPEVYKAIEDAILNKMTLKGITEISKVAYTQSAP